MTQTDLLKLVLRDARDLLAAFDRGYLEVDRPGSAFIAALRTSVSEAEYRVRKDEEARNGLD